VRPRDIGTVAETAVVRYLRANGWPNAERRALRGAYDCGDVTGTPGVCWEVKAGQAASTASDGQVALWLAETETERVNAKADIGILVLRRAGISGRNCGRWWAIMPLQVVDVRAPLRHRIDPVRLHLSTAVTLLHSYGYGDTAEEAS